MTHKEIESYADLNRFILSEIQRQANLNRGTSKKKIEIKINKVWFFKAIKLIQFTLKNDYNERDANIKIDETKVSWFKVQANNHPVIFTIYDL